MKPLLLKIGEQVTFCTRFLVNDKIVKIPGLDILKRVTKAMVNTFDARIELGELEKIKFPDALISEQVLEVTLALRTIQKSQNRRQEPVLLLGFSVNGVCTDGRLIVSGNVIVSVPC